MTDSEKFKAVSDYLLDAQSILKSGDAREHAYRPAFQKLIKKLKPDIQVINEPAYTGGNAPDFLFKKGDTPIAYAECKDVTVDITHKDVQKQANRYVDAFGRILLTNYYDFEILSEEGELVSISIAEKIDHNINPLEENFERFANIICDYITPLHRTIRSAKKLAKIMAGKARILRDNALASLTENRESDIYAQYKTFEEVLINDLSEQEFADMYAQTLVYGLFVARYFDSTLPTFSRHEAQDLLPASNPLLKKFFGHVAGTDYDPKIAWLVDSLVEAYLSTDVYELMHKEFAKKQKDPVLHFYETFLAEYDKRLRKSRGVYYTPVPVVSFIVRSVDQILKTKFNLPKGLADKSKIDHKFKIQAEDGRTKDGIKKITEQIHKVQILDPAVGTGTFLNEVIHEIHKSRGEGQGGSWSSYVDEHLLPRLHGFELLMASYTMAHLKLGVTLKELGYEGNDRLSVWLTNSLEESVHEVPNLFMSQWLTEESHEASKIKSELPIMVVMGNPPYSGVSSNNTDNANKLANKYKIEPGGEQKLQERKHWLNDDYVKFISFAESQIEKTGEGIVAFVTNHGYIDNPTFRGMRWHLLNTFDEIYIVDLHGNSLKKETAPDGGKDENVFDIMQGVAIILAVKKKKDYGNLAKLYHAELFGKRRVKYEQLENLDFKKTDWENVNYQEPYYFFCPKDYRAEEEYQRGFSVIKIFRENVTGIQTGKDALFIGDTRENLQDKIFRETGEIINNSYLQRIDYRPFDEKYCYFLESRTKNPYKNIKIPASYRSRFDVMKNFLSGENLAILLPRQLAGEDYYHVFVGKKIPEMCVISNKTKEQNVVFPLYLYHEDRTKIANFDQVIWEKIDKIVGKTKPEDIFDYIYAVLHSPSYREKYKEFLKIDFPRIPYPKDKKVFWKLVKLGRELRGLHLLESSKVNDFVTTFPESGANVVEQKYPKYEGRKVYINDTQYFGNVPEVAWDFYIGGYQPAQKWLKDRRDRELSVEDIEHYQKMIVALTETARIMEEIDKVTKNKLV